MWSWRAEREPVVDHDPSLAGSVMSAFRQDVFDWFRPETDRGQRSVAQGSQNEVRPLKLEASRDGNSKSSEHCFDTPVISGNCEQGSDRPNFITRFSPSD